MGRGGRGEAGARRQRLGRPGACAHGLPPPAAPAGQSGSHPHGSCGRHPIPRPKRVPPHQPGSQYSSAIAGACYEGRGRRPTAATTSTTPARRTRRQPPHVPVAAHRLPPKPLPLTTTAKRQPQLNSTPPQCLAPPKSLPPPPRPCRCQPPPSLRMAGSRSNRRPLPYPTAAIRSPSTQPPGTRDSSW